MLTFRTRTFVAMLVFAGFTLVYVSVGIRWHTYRARANLYARQEMEHTFEAANFTRAALAPGYTPDAPTRAARYKSMADNHARAAEECAKLREFYERSW